MKWVVCNLMLILVKSLKALRLLDGVVLPTSIKLSMRQKMCHVLLPEFKQNGQLSGNTLNMNFHSIQPYKKCFSFYTSKFK